MRWTRTLQTVDVHCEGEIGRVVTGGLIDVPGETVAAKLAHINNVDDSLRRFLTLEPRSGPAGSVVLLTPPTSPLAHAGFIVLQADRAHAMSGSNAICATTALLETGMVPMTEPETEVVLDTAAGLVRAVAACRDGACESVRLKMPQAFVEAQDEILETQEWGAVRYDLAFGGVFYALIDVEQVGLSIAPENARKLAEIGVELCRRLDAARPVKHPEIPEISGIAYAMFRSRDPDGALRTCTCMRPGRVDRSPCGTGSNAGLAVLAARGEIAPGDHLVTRSTIGGTFMVELLDQEPFAGRPAIRAEVTGRAWVYAMTQIGLDPRDPYPLGFSLSDTWGPLSGG